MLMNCVTWTRGPGDLINGNGLSRMDGVAVGHGDGVYGEER